MFRKQVYSADVEPRTIDDALHITHLQSKKLLEEYGIDFRFLLDALLVATPRASITASAAVPLARPPAFRAHAERTPEPLHTPSPTPVRSRSPAPPPSTPSRSRTPAPPVPDLPALVVPTPVPASMSPGRSPPTVRLRTPVPAPPPRAASQTSFRSQTPTNDGSGRMMGGRGTPAPPPPRSRDRPGSSADQRPPGSVMETPRRQGMF